LAPKVDIKAGDATAENGPDRKEVSSSFFVFCNSIWYINVINDQSFDDDVCMNVVTMSLFTQLVMMKN
jgi:hypothetical protein